MVCVFTNAAKPSSVRLPEKILGCFSPFLMNQIVGYPVTANPACRISFVGPFIFATSKTAAADGFAATARANLKYAGLIFLQRSHHGADTMRSTSWKHIRQHIVFRFSSLNILDGRPAEVILSSPRICALTLLEFKTSSSKVSATTCRTGPSFFSGTGSDTVCCSSRGVTR